MMIYKVDKKYASGELELLSVKATKDSFGNYCYEDTVFGKTVENSIASGQGDIGLTPDEAVRKFLARKRNEIVAIEKDMDKARRLLDPEEISHGKD